MKALFALLLIPTLALGSVEIKGSGTTNVAKVNADGSIQVNEGPSRRVTYIASASGLTTSAAYAMNIEAEAARGFKVSQICVSVTSATAAAGFTVSVRRQTAASSGGTALTQEGTGASAVSKMDPGDGNWTGTCRAGGTTAGTAGATLDQWGGMVGEIGAGTADGTGMAPYCKVYGLNGEKLPTVVAGTTNGLDIRVTSLGAGGLAFGAISVTFITET